MNRLNIVVAGAFACALLPWAGAAASGAADPHVDFSGPWVLNQD